MSMVDARGVGVSRRVDAKPDVAKSRDMILIGLRARRVSFRDIGRIMHISHVTAFKRWKAIPESVREHYAKTLG